MKTIAVNIQKGGSSKTLTCQVLGELLAKEGAQLTKNKKNKKVLLVDTDPQCNLSSVSGIDIAATQQHNLKTLLKNESSIEECIYHAKYYDIIPSSILLSNADTEFNTTGREKFLAEKLQGLDYDICLVDTPPGLNILNIMTLSAADSVLIPTECSVLAMIGLSQLQSTLTTIRKYSNPNIKIAGILVTRFNGRANINAAIYDNLRETAKNLNTIVFETKIRETVKVKEAQAQFLPVTDYAGRCSAVEDYRNFIKECKLF